VFTGLIQGLGTMRSLGEDRFVLSVQGNATQIIMSDLAIGDSVSVDGVCLTVEEILPSSFVATASPETLQRTILGQRTQGVEYVNLETSLRVGSKLGGHFVTGHVDGIGCLVEAISTEKSWEMTFIEPPSMSEQWHSYIAPYLIPKGSIAVNGISLTIADCDEQGSWFKVAVIPHTYAETNLCYLKSGDLINLESDILGKYVSKLLGHRFGQNSPQEPISLSFLGEHGYL
jgi:riboflavin synthase